MPSPPDALREALAHVIAEQRREWRLEHEVAEAQSARTVAELRARIVELEAELRGKVDAAIAQIPVPRDGNDGASVTLEQLAPVVDEAVARAVAALPTAEPGSSVTLEDLRPLVDEAVGRVVAALPPAKEGPPGKLPAVEDWQDRVYLESEVAAHEGATWQALRHTGKAPPHEDWRCIARAGRDGNDGRSLNPRSTWSATETYARLDVVALDGGAFVARRDDPGPCPGDGWQLIAMRGKPGRPGDKGDAVKGDPGKPGPAVVAIDIDATGMVTLTNADGTTVEQDFAPVLARLGR